MASPAQFTSCVVAALSEDMPRDLCKIVAEYGYEDHRIVFSHEVVVKGRCFCGRRIYAAQTNRYLSEHQWYSWRQDLYQRWRYFRVKGECVGSVQNWEICIQWMDPWGGWGSDREWYVVD